jgi:hypothetical protein
MGGIQPFLLLEDEIRGCLEEAWLQLAVYFLQL